MPFRDSSPAADLARGRSPRGPVEGPERPFFFSSLRKQRRARGGGTVCVQSPAVAVARAVG
eukprot:3417808-Lingulodinium_polyedra.AAC.1